MSRQEAKPGPVQVIDPLAYAAARVMGPGLAGLLEIGFFHPIDTIAKRLQSHHGAVVLRGQGVAAAHAHVAKIILRDAANQSALVKFKALYPGLSFAVSYKVAQRIYKFGGQPVVRDFLLKGSADGRPGAYLSFLQSFLCMLMGVGEVMLLPLDVLKIKAQTNPQTLQGRSALQIIAQERFRLFAGASWTLARNIPGSLALFGGTAAVKEHVFGLSGQQRATLGQTFVASAVGSILSLIVSSPLDVVKTRVQNQSFGVTQVTGTQVVRAMLREEGPAAFLRGITPKIVTVAPKLICSFTMAQYFTSAFMSAFGATREGGGGGGVASSAGGAGKGSAAAAGAVGKGG